jgi:hypothetical protein
MKEAGKERETPLYNFHFSVFSEFHRKGKALLLRCLSPFNLVEMVSRGYKIKSPIKFPNAVINATLTSLRQILPGLASEG